jgi:type IV pilus assembly protein PilP
VKRALLATALLVAIAAACGGPPPTATPAAPAAPQKTARAVADAGVAEIVATQPYMYNPIGKRDPFRSPEDRVLGPGSPDLDKLCNEPLCGFDLDQLQLVAVVSGDANPVAMVEDGQKVGYLVHRNSRMGKQGGKVTQIQRDCVVVTEYFQTPDGKVNPNRVNLCIKADKQSLPVLDLLQNKIFEAQ